MSDTANQAKWTIDYADTKAGPDERKSCDYWLARAERLNAERPHRYSGQFRRDAHLLLHH